MRFLIRSLVGTLFLMLVPSAHAQLLKDRVGTNYQHGSFGWTSQKVFGVGCYAIRSESENPTCASSNLSETENQETFFGINATGANDSTVYSQSQDALKGNDKIKLAQNLLANQNERKFEADSQIWWRGATWSLVLQPIRWTYFSAVRNSAYPELHIHAMQEQSISYYVGGVPKALGTETGVRFGLQTKILKRQLVQEQFNLFDAIPNIENYFQVKTQNQVLLEPSFSYLFDHENKTGLRPLLTFQVQNIGYTDKKLEEAPLSPIANLGLSVLPEIGEDDLELGVVYSFDEKLWQDRRLRWATQYSFEQIVLALGYDPRDVSFGIYTKKSPIKGGLSWRNTQYPDDLGSIQFDRSWQIEMGLVF